MKSRNSKAQNPPMLVLGYKRRLRMLQEFGQLGGGHLNNQGALQSEQLHHALGCRDDVT